MPVFSIQRSLLEIRDYSLGFSSNKSNRRKGESVSAAMRMALKKKRRIGRHTFFLLEKQLISVTTDIVYLIN